MTHYSFTALSHLAFQELIEHVQDQLGPEDVQTLQHHQQDVKKVVASKRLKHLHGQYQGGVNDSVSNRIARVKLLMREFKFIHTSFTVIEQFNDKKKENYLLLAGKNHQPSHEEDHSEHNKQGVTRSPPASAVVEHLCRLQK